MGLTDFYMKNYKNFLFIPLLIFIVSLAFIFIHFQNTGDFIDRDITLKGGVAITILEESTIDMGALETSVSELFPGHEVSVRTLGGTGSQIGYLIESDFEEISSEDIDSVIAIVGEMTGKDASAVEYSLETMGSSLGSSFFEQTVRAMIFAFLFMGLVVFLYFRSFVPSMGVILAALSDIVATIAILNIFSIKIGTAGIAALLMLIGYSIDTDIMLTTKVLKRKGQTLKEALQGAFKTGITMTLTTIAAVSAALFFSESTVISQIMTILLIGLCFDLVYTWLQNAGLLLWYVEKKHEPNN